VDRTQVANGGVGVGQALKLVKEQLRAVPDHGLGDGLLRHLNHDPRRLLPAVPGPQGSLNNLGRSSAAGGASGEPWTPGVDEGVLCGAALEGGRPEPETPMGHALGVTSLTEDHPDGPRLLLV
ncbi:hypothetical protein VM98_34690, partial [Streptomyces rubellomurinus subsp. indigoferus]